MGGDGVTAPPSRPGPAGGGASDRPIFAIHTAGEAERRPGEMVEDALRRAIRIIRRNQPEGLGR